MADEAKIQIPYVPYNTFNNSLTALAGTLPPRLDKSMWPSYSGAIQSQLWSTYKFFELVNTDGTPTQELVDYLNADDEGRKLRMLRWLTTYYPALMKLDLAKATVGHFSEAMREFGLGAETQKKATSFFLQAAKAAGMELSSFILKTSRTPGVKRAKRNGAVKPKVSQTPLPPAPPTHFGVPTGPSRSIALSNGITLTLTTSADTFRMTPDDRKFVNGILENLETYEAKHQPEDEGNGEDEED
jgi:hypothetical protein